MRTSISRALGALIAAACLLGTASAQELRLAVSRGPVSLPIYVAEARGFFMREGINVRLQDCSSGRQCMDLLDQGRAELATAAELLVTLDSLGAANTTIIATLSASAHHIKLIANRRAGIREAGDLRGKRIASVPRTSAQYFLDSWLVYHEIDPQDVTMAALPPDRLGPALMKGDVDAVAIWEPNASAALAALGPDAVLMPSPRLYVQHFCVVARRPLLAQREADLARLLRALARAEGFIADQPAQALAILKQRLADDAGTAHLLAEHDFRLSLDQSLIATMDGQARWAARLGLVPGGSRTDRLLEAIAPAPLRLAVPGAVELVR